MIVSRAGVTILAFAVFMQLLLPQSGAGQHDAIRKHKNQTKHKTYSQPLEPLVDKSFKPITLSGGVKHSESLPPIQSKLSVGAEYDEKKLEKPARSRDWYKVPAWLAGTWQSDFQTNISVDKNGKKNLLNTVKNHGIAHYGKQLDRKAGIWDYVEVPIEVQSETDKVINKDLTIKEVILKNSASSFVLKDVFTRRRVSKSTGKIIELTQMEQISSIQPIGKDKIEVLGSLKEFDRKGHTLGLTNAIVVFRRSSSFKQDNFDKASHEDLRPSFKLYLKTHSLEKLLPLKQL